MKIINTTNIQAVPISLLKEGQFFEIVDDKTLYISTHKTNYDDLNCYHATCLNNGHTCTFSHGSMVIPVTIEEIKYRYGFERDENR